MKMTETLTVAFGERPELRSLFGAALALIVSLLMAGCANQPSYSDEEPAGQLEDTRPAARQQARWWNLRFRLAWPEGAGPAWHMGPLIAHQFAAPALERHRDSISLWRFHRRAARDEAGHRFSLIFYADSVTARSLYREIKASKTMRDLQGAGDIMAVRLEDTGQSQVGATSDDNWNPAIQRSWPRFIMGVSRSWLGLLEELAGKTGIYLNRGDARPLSGCTGRAYGAVAARRCTRLPSSPKRHLQLPASDDALLTGRRRISFPRRTGDYPRETGQKIQMQSGVVL